MPSLTLSQAELDAVASRLLSEWAASEARRQHVDEVASAVAAQVASVLLEMRAGLSAEISRSLEAALPGSVLLEVERARQACDEADAALDSPDLATIGRVRALLATIDCSLRRVQAAVGRAARDAYALPLVGSSGALGALVGEWLDTLALLPETLPF